MPLVTAAIATAAGAPLLLGSAASGWTTYTVRPGDTVWDIASKHRTDVRTLVRANHLAEGGHLIRAGASLRVPGRATAAAHRATARTATARTARYVVRPGDTISHIALRLKVSPATLLRLNHLDARGRIYVGQHLAVPAAAARAQAKAAAARAIAARWTTYTVRSGDTVSHIATRLRTSQATILKANRLRSTAVIHPGQRLRVPRTTLTRPATRPGANSFAGRTYPDSVVRAAAANRHQLASRAVPSREATRRLIERTARRYGVDPALALAVGYQESGWNQRQVSVANAIGAMQVIPSSGQWASTLVGRRLNLLDAEDNVTAGVVILKALTTSAGRLDHAVAGYYQGLASVRSRGMHADTQQYVRSVLALRRQFA
ncbi:MAG: LysM peptidoglycan-binding domain-containing protein [Angustibacter sp.]